MVIGAVDRRPETQSVIGASREFEATMSGQLTCFANDLRLFVTTRGV